MLTPAMFQRFDWSCCILFWSFSFCVSANFTTNGDEQPWELQQRISGVPSWTRYEMCKTIDFDTAIAIPDASNAWNVNTRWFQNMLTARNVFFPPPQTTFVIFSFYFPSKYNPRYNFSEIKIQACGAHNNKFEIWNFCNELRHSIFKSMH